ncbi:HD domain-containing protein [Micromonospora soli]|uniref:HD domain-containing protein n=1 Tax=Micromonospora sp. NBRC 110009 TaxID=3061627 RepID=UPI00267379C7|nr:HD domain-containing protein [Micromonospora sp. NBRC 110009]WKT97231.1 HD domain-containing protein [Micromonospora sp. NBRC 110009]
MNDLERAALVAQAHLADALPRRWRHVQAVASKARELSHVTGEDPEILVTAAWLHDIGYAPALVDTGFHSLDGARWLVREHFPLRVANLVAYHSCAIYEAEERGLSQELSAEFSPETSPTSDALWFADMTTGPDGQNMTAEDRLTEIRDRYGPNHLVTRFWRRAEPMLMDAIQRTEARMASQPM